jgi:penicillin-binding protein 1C
MNREAAFIISDILSDRTARSLTFGYENPLSTRFWTAVKTGTSKDMRDNWCIGFSDKYTVGVWVGNFSGEPMWNVSGTSGAAPVWLETMNYLHLRKASKPPAPPTGVVAKSVVFNQSISSIEPARKEWFMKGTEPSDMKTEITAGDSPAEKNWEKPFIVYPPKDAIIAIDPDIPDENSLVFFQAEGNRPFDWILNNEKIGAGPAPFLWKPRYGKYVLSLADSQGHVMDSIHFEVRGRPLERSGPDTDAGE